MSEEGTSTIPWGADAAEERDPGAATEPAADSGPFGWLPRRSAREIRLERWLASWSRDGRVPPFLDWLQAGCGGSIVLKPPEIYWRASGLNRPGLIAQLTAPRLAGRLAIGIENAPAHTIVDRLLGFDRPFAESRLQLTPVEWGIWTFLILRALEAMAAHSTEAEAVAPDGIRSLHPGDLTLDRVGPDPFDATALGPIVTVRWAVQIGTTVGAVRLWLPESVAERWLDSPPRRNALRPSLDDATETKGAGPPVARGEIASQWRAEAGSIAMPQGLKRLRVGGVLPLTDTRLIGSPSSPGGPVDLIVDLDGQEGRFRIPARPVPDSGGRLVRVEDTPRQEPRPRDPILANVKESRTMSPSSPSSNPSASATEVGPLDVPVTLTVELGRVNLTVSRLADLKPGDVIELSRHSRAPVELTSNGRLVARGELILIDTDLGVRVTSIFL